MALSIEMITQEALKLSLSDRASLAETLLTSLAGATDPVIERAHLDEVRERRARAASGEASFIEGPEVFKAARAALRN